MSNSTLDDLYRFQEKRFTSFNHSLVVYIYGVDVTDWIRGSVSITYNGRDSYNTASFDLSNPRRIWQITEDNLRPNKFGGPLFRDTGDEYSESAKKTVFNYKQDPKVNLYWNLDITEAALGTREEHIDPAQVNASITTPNQFYPPNDTQEKKYRLAVNDCIFNKHDWIRIFSKNPFSSGYDQWVEVFCGFIQEHPITTNYMTGESSVRISASCIKQQLQKMRVNINVHAADQDSSPLLDKGFYRDFLKPSVSVHPFAQSSLENTIKELILGSPNPLRNEKAEKDEVKKRKVGHFQLGNIVCYDAGNPGNTLERWHLMTMFGVNKVPFPQGGNRDEMWLTTQEMERIGENTRPGDGPDAVVGGPTSRYLHMLLPKEGTGPSSLITYSVLSGSLATAREWSTRWEIIRDFASKMDFQVLTSPSGDILVEFPQYGFTPCAYLTNFGNIPVASDSQTETTADAAHAAKQSMSSPLSGTNKGKTSTKAFPNCHNSHNWDNSIANLFVFRIHQKEDTLNDEAEDFPTILQITGGQAFTNTNPTTQQEVHNPRGFVYAPALIDRYGVISETVDFPYAGQRESDIGGQPSALTKRLTQLGLVEFTKRMADASSWSGSVVYRPFLFPNRPIQLRRADRIGLMTGVTYQWTIGQNATTSVNCHMLMARRHDGSFRLLTGAINTPIDYGSIWSSADSQSSGAGVQVVMGSSQEVNAAAGPPGTATVGPPTQAGFTGKTLDGLFPPFKKIMENLIKVANDMGYPITITSAFRTQDDQTRIAREATATKNNPQGKSYLSIHQLGFAVDIKPSYLSGPANSPVYAAPLGAIYNAYKKIYKDADVIPVWGGSSSSFFTAGADSGLEKGGSHTGYDYVHFQIPASWGSGPSTLAIYKNYKARNLSDAEAVQKVWDTVKALHPNIDTSIDVKVTADFEGAGVVETRTMKGDATNALPAEDQKEFAPLANSSGEPTASQLQELKNSPPPVPCAGSFLTKRGLNG